MKLACAALLFALSPLPVLAQTATAPAPVNPPLAERLKKDAIKPPDRVAVAPVKGANSFTATQARERIAARGFTNVSKLTKDVDGIWRGTATRAGQTVAVSVDYTGAVFPR